MNAVQIAMPDIQRLAIEALKSRFIRIPSPNGYPRFRDLVTGIDQGDTGFLVDCFKTHGGSNQETVFLLDSLEFSYGDGFKPNAGTMLPGKLTNLWKAPEVKPAGITVSQEQVSPFFDLLNRWFSNEDERQYFIWWIAHCVRKPEKRIVATPLLRSEHGVGKGFLAETLMANLLGKQSVAVCALKDVVGDFNDVVEGKTLLLIDEVYKDNNTTTNKLKSIQGNSTIALRRKHKPSVTIDNYLNLIIASNSRTPLTLEKEDRRFWVPEYIHHKVSPQETGTFINDTLKPWWIQGGCQLVRDYLESVDLNEYEPTSPPPATESKKKLMGIAGGNSLEDLLASTVEEHKVLTVKAVKTDLALPHSDAAIAGALKQHGCILRRTRDQRYYITPFGLSSGLTAQSQAKYLEDCLVK